MSGHGATQMATGMIESPTLETERTASTSEGVHIGLKRRRAPTQKAVDALNGCLCGEVVNPLSDGGIRCKQLGCETQWVCNLLVFLVYIAENMFKYHLACVSLEIAPRNWLCNACEGTGRARGGKRPRK
jgi:hypothetical protein